jgi:hypothetical protein
MKTNFFKLSLIAFGYFFISSFSFRQDVSTSYYNNPELLPSAKVTLCSLPVSANPEVSYVLSKKDLMALDILCLEGLTNSSITGFRTLIIPVKGHLSELTSTGAKINATIKALITELKAGDKIIFESIKVTDRVTGQERTMTPISVQLK